jgi:putative radical SAM enzyme (TIGR03279 family)
LVEIIEVCPDSIAQEIGIASGDYILKINSETINDQLDYKFYSAEEYIELLLQRGDEQILFEIEKEFDEDIGISLQEMKMKSCGNNCVFCFVYQNPDGMRKAVYFKDEDYRFSFLYGHYVTLTTVNSEELQRIVKQQFSPLYISVHSTEEKTRKLLLGIKKDDHLLEKIDFLVKGGIELHTQIVLCPGINDGIIFDQTVEDLKQFYPGVKSIAVVPVGLTKHRNNLFELRLHTKDELLDMIDHTNNIRKKLFKQLGTSFIYLADEFFIKAGIPFPQTEYYENFYQIENGVGEFRTLIDQMENNLSSLPGEIIFPVHITWVTGTLAAQSLEKFIISKLKIIQNLTIDIIAIINKFYGENITISGLLTGQDIFERLNKIKLGDIIFLPPKVLNAEGMFLDNWTVARLEEKLSTKIHIYKEDITEIAEVINNVRNSK